MPTPKIQKNLKDRRKAFAGFSGKAIAVFLPKKLEVVLKTTAKKNGVSIRAEVRNIIAKAYGFKLLAVNS